MIDVREVDPAVTRDLRRRVLRPHQTVEELAAHEAPDGVWLAAYDGDRLVGCGAANPEPADEPGAWRIRAMATEPDARGRGVGSAVLRALLDDIARHGGTRAWCNARPPALGLYLRAGFERRGEEFALPQIGPHHVVSRDLA